MAMQQERLAIGLMSGTSISGIDVALLRTNGVQVGTRLGGKQVRYGPALKASLAAALDIAARARRKTPQLDALAAQITRIHADAVASLLDGWAGPAPDVIGFHGHTVLHRPDAHLTWQLGDGAMLAAMTGLPVVWDMRSNDVSKGGQGAPLESVYHQAVAQSVGRGGPVAILSLGGVSSVTWVGSHGDMMAMDCGPAMALMDLWMQHHGDAMFDAGGRVAMSGTARDGVVATMADNPYFDAPPPKSLDRLDFDLGAVRGLPLGDGMATLASFAAECVWMAQMHFPQPVSQWLVIGGGRHNPVLMQNLGQRLSAPLHALEREGFDADCLKAEAMAYLAVRSLQGLPLTYPETTGAPEALTGGTLSQP